MPHPLLIAARISPYRRAGSTAPVAVDDTGLSITSGQTRIVAILDNDLRAGATPTVSIVGTPTVPVTASITVADQMQVVANSGISSTTPFSVTYQLQTLSGISQAVVSGVVEPAVAATATIVARWDLNGNVDDAIGTIDGLIVNNVAFDQPSMLQGVSDTGVAMNGLGHLRIDDPGASGALDVLNQTAFGISVYGQISADPSDTVARQLVNKDAGQPKCGFAIEYVLAGSPPRSRLNPYIRTDVGGTGTARRFANVGGVTGLADLPVNTAFLVTFTFNPDTTPKCNCYLQLAGGNTVAFNGLTDESGITLGTLENFADLYLGVYFGGAGPMTGALQRLIFWRGAPTQAQHDALPNPQSITVTLPGAGNPPVAGDFTGRNIIATGTSFTLNPTGAPSTNAGAAVVSIVSVVPTGKVTATVGGDGQTVTIARITGQTGDYTVTYRLTVTGQPTDDGVISGNVATTSNMVQIPLQGTAPAFVPKSPGKPRNPSFSKPPLRTRVIDSTFPGIRIVRASDANGAPVGITGGGNWPLRSVFQYNSVPPWNHDESLLCPNNAPLSNGNILYLDGQYPYMPVFSRDVGADPKLLRWRPWHSDQQIYVANNRINAYNPFNNTHDTQLGGPFTGVSDLSFGIYPSTGMNGQFSYDGNRLVVSGYRSSTNRTIAFMYDLDTQTKGPDIPLYVGDKADYDNTIVAVNPGTSFSDHDFVIIDASGQFVLHAFDGGNDMCVFDAEGSGTLRVNTSRTSGHPLHDRVKHPDSTLSANGSTPYLMFADRSDGDRLSRVTLPTLNETSLEQFTLTSDRTTSHASGTRQYRQRSDGNRFMSCFGTRNSGNDASLEPLNNAVFRCNVDNGDIHVFAHHNTAGSGSPTGSEAWNAISPSGTRCVFISTWASFNTTDSSNGNLQMYVIEHWEYLNT